MTDCELFFDILYIICEEQAAVDLGRELGANKIDFSAAFDLACHFELLFEVALCGS